MAEFNIYFYNFFCFSYRVNTIDWKLSHSPSTNTKLLYSHHCLMQGISVLLPFQTKGFQILSLSSKYMSLATQGPYHPASYLVDCVFEPRFRHCQS
jgi:hypothetical protein